MEMCMRRYTGRRGRIGLQIAVLTCLIAGCMLRAEGAARADTRIVLRPDMVVNESAIGDAGRLVDEQGAVGDPAAGKGVRPERPYFPGWTAWQYPIQVFLDLGADYDVTRVMLYNDTGEHKLILSTGRPFAWKEMPVTLGGYREWRGFDLNTATRFLRVTLLSPTSLSELVLYGVKRAESPAKPSVPRRPPVQPPMDQFIGVNAFIDDPLEKLARPVGFVREYHSWQWDTEAPDHQVRVQPSGAAGGNAWFFDDYYSRLLGYGITVSPAIQQSSPVYFPGPDLEAKPIAAGADSEAPASYAVQAAHMFQYAARYGSATVPDDLLHLGPGQPRKSGLKSLRSACIVWCATTEGRKVAGISVPTPGATVTRIDFANDKIEGQATTLRADHGKVTLEATEKPVILLFKAK